MRNSDADMPMEHRIDGAGDAERMADMPREPQVEEANEPELMSRRELLRLGLAGVSAFALTRLGLGQIHTEPVPTNRRRIVEIPPDFTQALWRTVLEPDPRVQHLVSLFRSQGFRFIPRLMNGFIAVSGSHEPKPAGILVFWHTFKPFSPAELSHDEWTIMSLYTSCVHTVLAGGFTVDHRTWRIASCQSIEFDSDGNPHTRQVPREVLLRGPKAIAEALGEPTFGPYDWDPRFGAADPRSTEELAPALFAQWLNTWELRSLYPPNAVRVLLNDAPILAAMSTANYVRYTGAFQAAGVRCTSTCTTTCTTTCCWGNGGSEDDGGSKDGSE